MKQLQSIDEYKKITKEEKVILMFSADWCPDCRVIEPILPEIEQENSEFTFYYVDRDEYIDLCAELNVFGIPSFVAFHEGKEVGRFVNKDRKSKEQIQEFIDSISI
ncbi:thioredoxin family protein [Metabacillus halosaccharovorans]|uniref:Thioredoxin family protein n=1 Tax=Metabacillus halosaccharovorans TaxID=930124 RepID=A0ABT3DPQ1_9BACI|nr:thioredoxin family protein [Metabacillus halosaccharovorans]MCV9888893.1 thioredoxin family protein [Metabacillus halosaccharovorans]